MRSDAGTQTPSVFVTLTTFANPVTPYFVSRKASEFGSRVEVRHRALCGFPIELGAQGTLWDLPKTTHRHQVSACTCACFDMHDTLILAL